MMFASTFVVLLAVFVFYATACTDTIYVGSVEGYLAQSKDGGETWKTVLNSGGFIHSISASGDVVYAGSPYGIAISRDAGGLWSYTNLQTNTSCDSIVAGVYVDDKDRVYALIGQKEGCGRVAISSNYGNDWPINFPLPSPPFTNYPYSIYVDGQRIYVASEGGLGFTDDQGATWTFKNRSNGLPSDHVLCVIGKGDTIYTGLDMDGGPVSISTDGGNTWKTTRTTPLGLIDYTWTLYLHNDTLYAATYGGGLSLTSDFSNWTRKTTVDCLASNYTYVITGSGNNLYLGTYGSGLSISRDNGETWITKTTKDGLASDAIWSVFVQCV